MTTTTTRPPTPSVTRAGDGSSTPAPAQGAAGRGWVTGRLVSLVAHATGQDLGPLARRRRRRGGIAFLALAGPNIGLLLLFVYRPLLQGLYLSTLQWNLGSPVARFIGLGNYVEWFRAPSTAQVLTTTGIFTVSTVGGALVIGLGLALLLDRRLPGRSVARTVAFAPYVLSGLAVGILWLFIFDPRYGLLAEVLGWFGASSPQWYTEPPWPLVMIIVVYLWKNLGYVALIYMAGLQAIPQDLRDAAALDGASPARTLRSIVLPLLMPTTFFLLVTMMLSSLQSFDIIQGMTKGGPVGSTTTLMYQIYQEGFVNGRAGYASAGATVLFLILLGVTALQMRFVERKVHYA